MAMFLIRTFACVLVLYKGVYSQSIIFPGASLPDNPKEILPPTGREAQNDVLCATTDTKLPCILPFTFGNETFDTCITISDPDGRPWCSTKVIDGTDIHISGGGHWGYCNEHCPITVTTASEVDTEEASESDEDDESDVCQRSDGQPGRCQPASLCIGLTSQDEDDNACGEDSDGFICCKELLKNNQQIVTQLKSNAAKETKVEKPESVSLEEVEQTLFGVRLGFPEVADVNVKPALGASVIDGPADEVEDESPADFHLRFNRPRTEVLKVDEAATKLLSATDALSANNQDGFFGLRFFDKDVSTRINAECPWTPTPSCDSVASLKFRSFDGTCNNFQEPNYGRAATPFQRILAPDYSGGSLQLPRKSVTAGFDLPSARALSTVMTTSDNNNRITDTIHTVLVMQMGQFIDHDVTHTPNHAKGDCCNSDGSFPTRYDAATCYPIDIPIDDAFWIGKKTCMNFARSLAAPNLKCSLESRQQMNQITHWLDASNIYGSSKNDANKLRQRFGGQMKVTRQIGSRLGVLPSCASEVSGTVSACKGCKSCFYAGDARANEQLNLIVMHTVWLREHNRIARFMQKLNPHWNDERIFQETRRIVIAEYQHVIFKEWLPLILGHEFMTTFGLWPLTKGYSRDYLSVFDPRVTNEFATAAFRFGHSLIPSQFSRVTNKGGPSRSSRLVTQTMSMKDIFFKPQQLKANPGIMDDMVRGLLAQNGDRWDNRFAEDITNHLFESRRGSGGLDLVALNIQRGRDHGLRGYNDYREVCAIGRARNFNDLADFIAQEDIDKLKDMYNDVDDIDLYVGGFLEQGHRDSILGPTFKCLIGDTFARLKMGDRFFYDLGLNQNTIFSTAQLREIRRTSMSRILCDNTDSVHEMQPQAFKLPDSSRTNAVTSCSNIKSIPVVNLSIFKD